MEAKLLSPIILLEEKIEQYKVKVDTYTQRINDVKDILSFYASHEISDYIESLPNESVKFEYRFGKLCLYVSEKSIWSRLDPFIQTDSHYIYLNFKKVFDKKIYLYPMYYYGWFSRDLYSIHTTYGSERIWSEYEEAMRFIGDRGSGASEEDLIRFEKKFLRNTLLKNAVMMHSRREII